MEEYIKILSDYLDENDRKFIKPKGLKILQAIENLINKNKEQEAELYASNSIINEYIESNKEQEKMIELMASFIEVAELDEDIAKAYCLNQNCNNINEHTCNKCIIDYFRKKAKGE